MEIIPVWRDTIVKYTLTDLVDSVTYKIYLQNGSTPIFTGRAYRRPNTDYVEFKINKIAENYLKQSLGDGSMAVNSFYVYIDEKPLAPYAFYYAYDYTQGPITDKCMVLSSPINNKVASEGKIVFSALNATNSTYTLNVEKLVNGTWSNHTIEYIPKGSLVNKIYDVADFGNATKIRVMDKIWDIVCADYQLIYLNKYGGYDVVNLNGKLGKVDNMSSKSYTKSYNNTTNEWGENKYNNVITTEYEGHIYFLNQKQSETLDNLYCSTEVYLYDINKGIMKPVIIKDSSLDYQSYKKLRVFKIKMVESQKRKR